MGPFLAAFVRRTEPFTLFDATEIRSIASDYERAPGSSEEVSRLRRDDGPRACQCAARGRQAWGGGALRGVSLGVGYFTPPALAHCLVGGCRERGACSLHRDALRQVARLIDVAAEARAPA